MPTRRIRRRIRGTKPRTHLSAPFRRIPQAMKHNLPSRRRSRASRI